jgi:hypothetical protein
MHCVTPLAKDRVSWHKIMTKKSPAGESLLTSKAKMWSNGEPSVSPSECNRFVVFKEDFEIVCGVRTTGIFLTGVDQKDQRYDSYFQESKNNKPGSCFAI